jgi:hypothetical protein
MSDAPVDFFPSSYHETPEVAGAIGLSGSGVYGRGGLNNSMDPLGTLFEDEPPLLDGETVR